MCAVLFIFSCNQVYEPASITTGRGDHFEFDLADSIYVVLPFQADWDWIFKDVKQADLSKAELEEIEHILSLAIRDNNAQQQILLNSHNKEYPNQIWNETGFEIKLDGYLRQYIPITNELGEKEVWINFFCDDWNSDVWKSGIIIVLDGGNCYFNLKVNLTKKTYYELSINGYA